MSAVRITIEYDTGAIKELIGNDASSYLQKLSDCITIAYIHGVVPGFDEVWCYRDSRAPVHLLTLDRNASSAGIVRPKSSPVKYTAKRNTAGVYVLDEPYAELVFPPPQSYDDGIRVHPSNSTLTEIILDFTPDIESYDADPYRIFRFSS